MIGQLAERRGFAPTGAGSYRLRQAKNFTASATNPTITATFTTVAITPTTHESTEKATTTATTPITTLTTAPVKVIGEPELRRSRFTYPGYTHRSPL